MAPRNSIRSGWLREMLLKFRSVHVGFLCRRRVVRKAIRGVLDQPIGDLSLGQAPQIINPTVANAIANFSFDHKI